MKQIQIVKRKRETKQIQIENKGQERNIFASRGAGRPRPPLTASNFSKASCAAAERPRGGLAVSGQRRDIRLGLVRNGATVLGHVLRVDARPSRGVAPRRQPHLCRASWRSKHGGGNAGGRRDLLVVGNCVALRGVGNYLDGENAVRDRWLLKLGRMRWCAALVGGEVGLVPGGLVVDSVLLLTTSASHFSG
jgi:hypothetical protein